MPPVTAPAVLTEDPRFSRWDLALVVAMGVALVVFGWVDGASYLASRHKLPFNFAMNSRPGGVRVGTTEEIFRHATTDYVRLENFTALEHRGGVNYRHSLGPVSSLEIVTSHTRARLSFRFDNVITGEDLVIACNGRVMEQFDQLPLDTTIPRLYALELHPGPNVVTFTYRLYNHHGTEFAPDDPRPVSGTFGSLDLLLE